MNQEANGYVRQRDLDPIHERLRILDAHHEALRVGLVGSDDLPGGRLGQIGEHLVRIDAELARLPELMRTLISEQRQQHTGRLATKGIEWGLTTLGLFVAGIVVAILSVHFGSH